MKWDSPAGDTHAPILPEGEIRSAWEGIRRFLPLAFRYSLRHLTLGSWVRARRRYRKWRGEKYVV